jgi:glucose-6-phosphate isomerase
LSEQYLKSFEDGKNISLFWFYNSATRWLGGWIQQLWAESLGKTLNRKNGLAHFFSTPVVAIGSSDQHSILQQVMDGEKNKLVTFFRFDHIEKQGPILAETLFKETAPLKNKNTGELIKAQAKGTADALTENGVPQMTLVLENLNEKSLGYFFMTFQLVVSVLAEHHDVNAFDQPGVQLGKLKTIDELQK